MQQCKLGGSSAEKRFGSPGRKQAGQETAVCPSRKEGQLCPWLYYPTVWPAAQGRLLFPSFEHWGGTSVVLGPVLGCQCKKDTGMLEQIQPRPTKLSRGWTTWHRRSSWESGFCSDWSRGHSGETYNAVSSYLIRRYKDGAKLSQTFLRCAQQ